MRTEYEITSISETYEVEGEVINVEMVDTVTSDIILGSVKTIPGETTTKVTVSFSTTPTNPIKVVIFSTK